MNDDAIDRALDRQRLGHAALVGNRSASRRAPGTAARRGCDRYPIGARVFDVQIAQDGTIVRPPPGTAPRPDQAYVKFDSGVTNLRATRDLLVRPTPPGR